MIYFIQCQNTCHIKIGFTQGDPDLRMAALQIGSGGKLEVVHQMEGDRATEAKLHKEFAASHVHGEWFKPTIDLIWFLMSDAERRAYDEGETVGAHMGLDRWNEFNGKNAQPEA